MNSEPVSVLIVDNNPTFLRAASQFLSQEKEERVRVIGTAGGGEECLELVTDLQPEVVLMDLSMPGLSGLEAVPRLRALLPTVGIIILTLLDTLEYRRASIQAGADEFVPKAVLTTELIPAILRVAAAQKNSRAPSSADASTGRLQ